MRLEVGRIIPIPDSGSKLAVEPFATYLSDQVEQAQPVITPNEAPMLTVMEKLFLGIRQGGIRQEDNYPIDYRDIDFQPDMNQLNQVRVGRANTFEVKIVQIRDKNQEPVIIAKTTVKVVSEGESTTFFPISERQEFYQSLTQLMMQIKSQLQGEVPRVTPAKTSRITVLSSTLRKL